MYKVIRRVAVEKPQIFAGPARNFCSGKPEMEIPKNVLDKKGLISSSAQSENGFIYDKKPFKMPLVAGKKYVWCLCGHSHTQPFCDGTHRNQQLKIKQKPVAFVVEKTQDYWLCNCKQTKNRPFCDGTHKQQAVIDGTSIVRQ